MERLDSRCLAQHSRHRSIAASRSFLARHSSRHPWLLFQDRGAQSVAVQAPPGTAISGRITLRKSSPRKTSRLLLVWAIPCAVLSSRVMQGPALSPYLVEAPVHHPEPVSGLGAARGNGGQAGAGPAHNQEDFPAKTASTNRSEERQGAKSRTGTGRRPQSRHGSWVWRGAHAQRGGSKVCAMQRSTRLEEQSRCASRASGLPVTVAVMPRGRTAKERLGGVSG